jgi:YgiT-type zinc finger domain-containing protein
MTKRCYTKGCSGEYQDELVLRAMRFRDRVIVVDDIPAEVCDLCGSTLFTPDVIQKLDQLVRDPQEPSDTVPLYHYPAEGLLALSGKGASLGDVEGAE